MDLAAAEIKAEINAEIKRKDKMQRCDAEMRCRDEGIEARNDMQGWKRAAQLYEQHNCTSSTTVRAAREAQSPSHLGRLHIIRYCS
jgi:hypothetical protein